MWQAVSGAEDAIALHARGPCNRTARRHTLQERRGVPETLAGYVTFIELSNV